MEAYVTAVLGLQIYFEGKSVILHLRSKAYALLVSRRETAHVLSTRTRLQ